MVGDGVIMLPCHQLSIRLYFIRLYISSIQCSSLHSGYYLHSICIAE